MSKYAINNDERTVSISKRNFSTLSEKETKEINQLASFGYKVVVQAEEARDRRTKEWFEKKLADNPTALAEFKALCAEPGKGFFAAKSYAKSVIDGEVDA